MKVLVLNYEFPPVGGGGGRVADDVARGLAARGHAVQVLTARAPGLARKERRDGITIHRIECLRRHADRCSVPEMAAYVVAASAPALALARRWQPDVMHAHFAVPTGAVAYAVHRATRIPYVLTAHLGDVPGGVPEQTAALFRWLKPLTVPIWRRAAAVTAVSSHVCELAARAYGLKPRLILNGIELTVPPPILQPAPPLRLVWCGRIQAQKNLLFGLRQLAALGDLDWRLAVLGDGPQRAEAEALARTLGLADRIDFQGWVGADAVTRALAQAHVLYMPSLSEGLPMVAVQALGHGLAIVGSRIGGLADVVGDGENGFLCPLDAPSSFAAALGTLASDPALLTRMRRASRERAERFALPSIIDAYERTCLEAVGRRRA